MSAATSTAVETQADVDTALLTLAVMGGNSARASKLLKEKGITVPERTLRRWKSEVHADRYSELAREHSREIEQRVVQDARELAVTYSELEAMAAEATMKAIKNGDIKDPSAAMKNAAISKGITLDSMLKLEGRHVDVVDTLDARDIVADIMRIVAPYAPKPADVDSDAVELAP